MSDLKPPPAPLNPILLQLRRRQRLQNTLRLAGRAALYGGILAVAGAAGAAILRPDWIRLGQWLSLLIIPAVAGLGAVIGLLLPVNSLRVARALDKAAASADRFASAFQLAGHRRQACARLVVEDALGAVRTTPPKTAIAVRAPAELKWLCLPLLLIAAVMWLGPGPRAGAQPPAPSEVSPEEWAQLTSEFRRELDDQPKPETEEEKEIADQLDKLAAMLEKQPDKKDALAQIAKLQAELESRRQALSTKDVSVQQAAQAMRASQVLSRFAGLLRQGEYGKAAEELQSLADRLNKNELPLTAAEYEAAASDMDKLSKELSRCDELSQSCKNCANAASSMNRNKLAEALKNLSQCTQKNARSLKRCDGLCRSTSMLDQLKQRLSRCSSCKGSGKSPAFVKHSNKKGGLKAGWGTAPVWSGGNLSNRQDQRLPDLTDARETEGASTIHPMVSADERARSAQDYKELYADFVRKAEADLALERVPPAYRDYLRRYFVAIRPQEEEKPSPTEPD